MIFWLWREKNPGRVKLNRGGTNRKIAAVVRNAENGCYVMQCLLNPVPVERSVQLNGMDFNSTDANQQRVRIFRPARFRHLSCESYDAAPLINLAGLSGHQLT